MKNLGNLYQIKNHHITEAEKFKKGAIIYTKTNTYTRKKKKPPVASDPMKKQNFILKRQMAMLFIPTVTVTAPLCYILY